MPDCRICWIHAITPVHIGTGTGLGFIDLPIAREKTTNWPFAPGSGLKGVLADHHGAARAQDRKDASKPQLRSAFGVADDPISKEANSGALVITDARLVCMPVRSIYGTFAWVTSPLALKRLARDLSCAGLADLAVPGIPQGSQGIVPNEPTSVLRDSRNRVFLADVDYLVQPSAEASIWAKRLAEWLFPIEIAWRSAFCQRFVLTEDDVFSYFSETATEVITRVHIDPTTRTVMSGQLWTEEALPAEAILAGLVWCDKLYYGRNNGITPKSLLDEFCSGELLLQIGGKATIGRGQVRAVFTAA